MSDDSNDNSAGVVETEIAPSNATPQLDPPKNGDNKPGDDQAKPKSKRGRKPKADKGKAKAEAKPEFVFATEIKVSAATRFIGVRHRVKQTADNEARPTQLAVFESNGHIRRLDLETEQQELWWVFGLFPTQYRDVEITDNLASSLAAFRAICEANDLVPQESDPDRSKLFASLCLTRKLKKDEDEKAIQPNLLRTVDDETHVINKAPIAFDGLTAGDIHVASLGGSGDKLAFALSRRSERLQNKMGLRTAIMRVPPRLLKEQREKQNRDKDTDSSTLVELWQVTPSAFYECDVRDRERILVTESVRQRVEAMKARLGCGQRLRSHFIGKVFINNEYPEGNLEARYQDTQANDVIFQALESEEDKCKKEIEHAVKGIDVCDMLMEIDGVGPMTAANLFSAIGDVRRFQVLPDQVQLSELRAKARQAMEDGKWLDDALEVIVRPKTVKPSDAPKSMTKLERAKDNFIQARALGAVRERFAKQDFEAANRQLVADGKPPVPEQVVPDEPPFMLHLPSLLAAIADIKAKKGQGPQVASLHEAMRLLKEQGNLADEAMTSLVSRIRELAQAGGLLDELLEVRDRAIFERFVFLQGLLRHKQRVGKESEAAKIEESLKYFNDAAYLKRKALHKSQAKLRHFCGVFVRQGGKYADVPPEMAFPRKRRGMTCNWDPMARQRLFLFTQDQCNRQAGSPWGLFLRLNKRLYREKHPVPIEVEKKAKEDGQAGKKVKRYTDGHINKMAGWKTASHFIDLLYEAWIALEEDYRRRTTKQS